MRYAGTEPRAPPGYSQGNSRPACAIHIANCFCCLHACHRKRPPRSQIFSLIVAPSKRSTPLLDENQGSSELKLTSPMVPVVKTSSAQYSSTRVTLLSSAGIFSSHASSRMMLLAVASQASGIIRRSERCSMRRITFHAVPMSGARCYIKRERFFGLPQLVSEFDVRSLWGRPRKRKRTR